MRWVYAIAGTLLLALVAFNIWIWVNDHTYVYRAFWHLHSTIYDYHIFENRTVEKGDELVIPEHAMYNREALPDTIENRLIENNTTAFLILKDGELLYENYWGSGSKDTLSNSFSMAKTIVALLTGIAKDKGYIESLDDPVSKYYPPYREKGRETITIRHLLNMRSGLYWQETYDRPFNKTTEAYYGTDLPGLINRLKPENRPGEKFDYSSGDTQVLGLMLKEITGNNLSRLASENLWKPLGAGKDALWSLDRKGGNEKAYCCFHSTARDFARLGMLINNEGVWGDDTLVNPAYVRNMRKPAPSGEINFYRKKTWLFPVIDGQQAFYLRGLHGQYVIGIPELDAVAVRLGHDWEPMMGAHPADAVLIARFLVNF